MRQVFFRCCLQEICSTFLVLGLDGDCLEGKTCFLYFSIEKKGLNFFTCNSLKTLSSKSYYTTKCPSIKIKVKPFLKRNGYERYLLLLLGFLEF